MDKATCMCYTVIRKEVIFMPHVSLRVSEQEKIQMDSYAKLHGLNLSDAIKDSFFEKLENEYDLRAVYDYEVEKEKGDVKFYSHEEVGKILGIK
jgi:hypothetical protein